MICDEKIQNMLQKHGVIHKISFSVFGAIHPNDIQVLGMASSAFLNMVDGGYCILILEEIDEDMARAMNTFICNQVTIYSSILLNDSQKEDMVNLISSGIEHLRFKHELTEIEVIENVWI